MLLVILVARTIWLSLELGSYEVKCCLRGGEQNEKSPPHVLMDVGDGRLYILICMRDYLLFVYTLHATATKIRT